MISALADAGAVLGERALPRRRGRAPPSSCCATCATTAGRLLRTYNRGPRAPRRLPRGPRVPARGAADALRGDVRPALVRRGARARRRRSSTASPTPSAAASSRPRADHETLIARRKELEDAPIPAGGSAAAFGLLRLARADRRGALRGRGAAASCGCCTRSRPSIRTRSATCCRRSTSRSPTCARWRWWATTAAPLEQVVRAAFRPHLVLAGGAAGRRAAARGARAGRRPRRGLRVRALRLPAAGDRAGGAARRC